MIAALALVFVLVQDPTDTAQRAAQAYRTGDHAAAATLYESLRGEPTIAPGPLHFDLGNCAFRLGRYPEAILQYRRAQRWLGNDPELAFNLQMTEQQLGLEARAAPSVFADVDPWLVLAVSLLLQCVGLVGIVRGAHTVRRLVAAFSFGVGFALTGGLLTAAREGPPRDGVVVVDGATIKSEPLAGMPVVTTLRAGEVVRVAELSDRWMRVTIADLEGWLERSAVVLVVEPDPAAPPR